MKMIWTHPQKNKTIQYNKEESHLESTGQKIQRMTKSKVEREVEDGVKEIRKTKNSLGTAAPGRSWRSLIDGLCPSGC